MSTNCARCVVNKRADTGLFCESCGVIEEAMTALEGLLSDVLNLGSFSITSRPSVDKARVAIEKLCMWPPSPPPSGPDLACKERTRGRGTMGRRQ